MTRAGYYAWRARPVSAHAVQDRQLTQRLQQLFRQHHGRYGSPRLCRALRDRLVARGYRQSAVRRGPEDNAHMESFFHSLKGS